jgi:signal transduction histidine kinase
LAQGIYPAILAERGPVDALQTTWRRSIQTVVVGAGMVSIEDLSVEAAIYFVTLEAIQNVAKPATDETTVTITLQQGDNLEILVIDDGPGFDVEAHGRSRGLTDMADRVAALGGELTLVSAPGEGPQSLLRYRSAGGLRHERVNRNRRRQPADA